MKLMTMILLTQPQNNWKCKFFKFNLVRLFLGYILFFDFSLKSKYEMSLKRFAIARNTCALAYDEAMMGHACMEEGYRLIISRKYLFLIFLVISNLLWPFSTHVFLSAMSLSLTLLSRSASKDLNFFLLPSFCL